MNQNNATNYATNNVMPQYYQNVVKSDIQKSKTFPMITERFEIPQSKAFVMERLLDTDSFTRMIVPRMFKSGGRIAGNNGEIGSLYEYFYWTYVSNGQYGGHMERRTFTFRVKDITDSSLVLTKFNSSSGRFWCKLPRQYDFVYQVHKNIDPYSSKRSCVLVMTFPETSKNRLVPTILLGIVSVGIMPLMVNSYKKSVVKQEKAGRLAAVNYLAKDILF